MLVPLGLAGFDPAARQEVSRARDGRRRGRRSAAAASSPTSSGPAPPAPRQPARPPPRARARRRGVGRPAARPRRPDGVHARRRDGRARGDVRLPLSVRVRLGWLRAPAGRPAQLPVPDPDHRRRPRHPRTHRPHPGAGVPARRAQRSRLPVRRPGRRQRDQHPALERRRAPRRSSTSRRAASIALDDDDFAIMQIVADRLAAALALGRERQKLTERAALLDRLTASRRS